MGLQDGRPRQIHGAKRKCIFKGKSAIHGPLLLIHAVESDTVDNKISPLTGFEMLTFW